MELLLWGEKKRARSRTSSKTAISTTTLSNFPKGRRLLYKHLKKYSAKIAFVLLSRGWREENKLLIATWIWVLNSWILCRRIIKWVGIILLHSPFWLIYTNSKRVVQSVSMRFWNYTFEKCKASGMHQLQLKFYLWITRHLVLLFLSSMTVKTYLISSWTHFKETWMVSYWVTFVSIIT